jgi:hypothetical protein
MLDPDGVLLLNTRRKVLAWHPLSPTARDVIRAALLATAIIVDPSGDESRRRAVTDGSRPPATASP